MTVATSSDDPKLLVSSSSTHSSSFIGSNSNHSSSVSSSTSRSSTRLGTFVSITVRKENDHNNPNSNSTNTRTHPKKVGLKLQQDSTGRVKVKNIARNGLFEATELEVGDIILSVNRRKLKDGEGPDELLKWVHKYNTITISVRKPPQPPPSMITSSSSTSASTSTLATASVSSSSSAITSSATRTTDASEKKGKKKKKKAATKSTTSKKSTTRERNKKEKEKKIVTFTAEKHVTTGNDRNNNTSDENSSVGLVFEIRNNDQLFVKVGSSDIIIMIFSSTLSILPPSSLLIVPNSISFFSFSFTLLYCVSKDIRPTSIFPIATAMNDTSTTLNIGDRILCINDMNFRQFADLEYAYRIIRRSKIMITLVVEKQPSDDREKKKTKNKKKTPSLPSTMTTRTISSSTITPVQSSFSLTINNDDDDTISISSIDDSTHSNGKIAAPSAKKKKTTTKKKTKKNKRRDHNNNLLSSLSNDNDNNNNLLMTTNSSRYNFEVESDFKIEKYKPMTITVPKPHRFACSTDTIGIKFSLIKTMIGDVLNDIEEDGNEFVLCNGTTRKTTSWIAVTCIDKDSFFADTPLCVGDKIISINDTDLRESVANISINNNHFVDTRKAYQACLQAKEFISMVVLKQDANYFEKSFLFDTSVTNLEWKY